jgi:hypothetical protein
MTRSVSIPVDYSNVLEEIKSRVRSAQYEALKAVNRKLITLYCDIGRIIVARQQDESWGRSVVERLASDLRKELPGVAGFSASNLWRMRSFYLSYAANEKLAPMVREIGCGQRLYHTLHKKLQPLAAEIGWTHHGCVSFRTTIGGSQEGSLSLAREPGGLPAISRWLSPQGDTTGRQTT